MNCSCLTIANLLSYDEKPYFYWSRSLIPSYIFEIFQGLFRELVNLLYAIEIVQGQLRQWNAPNWKLIPRDFCVPYGDGRK